VRRGRTRIVLYPARYLPSGAPLVRGGWEKREREREKKETLSPVLNLSGMIASDEFPSARERETRSPSERRPCESPDPRSVSARFHSRAGLRFEAASGSSRDTRDIFGTSGAYETGKYRITRRAINVPDGGREGREGSRALPQSRLFSTRARV